MKIKTLALTIAATAALAATQAQATSFEIDYIGTSATSGPIVAHLTGEETNGVATSIFGTRNGVAVTGLSPYAAATQTITSTFPFTDFGGLSYSTADGINYNIYADTTGDFELNSVLNPGGNPSGDAPITAAVTIAAVPETATWAMMLAGFGMIGFAARRRTSVTTAVRFA